MLNLFIPSYSFPLLAFSESSFAITFSVYSILVLCHPAKHTATSTLDGVTRSSARPRLPCYAQGGGIFFPCVILVLSDIDHAGIGLMHTGIDVIPIGIALIQIDFDPIPIHFALIPIGIRSMSTGIALMSIDIGPFSIGIVLIPV